MVNSMVGHIAFKLLLCIPLVFLICSVAAQDNQQLDVYFNISVKNVSSNDLPKTVINQTSLKDAIDTLAISVPALGGVQLATVQESVYAGDVTVQVCPIGTYSSATVTGCIPCPAGTYSLQMSASTPDVCQKCPAGTWSSVSAASTAAVCTQCPQNTYSIVLAASSESTCTTCPPNTVAPVGSTAISDCKCATGYYIYNGTCTKCTAGNFCANGIKNPCPSYPFATSADGASKPSDCYCIAGYYGDPGAEYGSCDQCIGGSYCPAGQQNKEPIACPDASDSPYGSSSLSDCKCYTGYEQNDWSTSTWNLQTSSVACLCSLDSPCSTQDACECSAGAVCGISCSTSSTCAPTVLRCKQGYLQLYDVNYYQTNTKQTWIIAPEGAATVTLSFTLLCTEKDRDTVQVFSCPDSTCTSSTVLGTYSGCNSPIPNPVTSNTPYMKVMWTSNGNTVQVGWQATYSSILPCAALQLAVNDNTHNNTAVPLYMWVGDTLNLYSAFITMGLQKSPGTNNLVAPSQMFQYVLTETGKFYLVDAFMPSRNIPVVVMPGSPTNWDVQLEFSISAQAYIMSGDITGTNPTIYLTTGDTLVLSRMTSGYNVQICSAVTPVSSSLPNGACTALPGTSSLAGQGTSQLTWITTGYSAGTYYYTTTSKPGGNNGTIILVQRPTGMSCKLCTAGEYCYAGDKFVCPANSVSADGATDPSQCTCVPGFYTDTTDMQQYHNSQYVDSGGRHSCVVTEGNLLYCWGANEVGQLGIGKTSVTETPQQVPITNVSQVALGYDFTCVVFMDGKVRCWGGNGYGQLGLGQSGSTSTQTASNVANANLGIDYSVSQLSCADFTCCAIVKCAPSPSSSIQQTGVKCWGRGDAYQLGYSPSGSVGLTISSMGSNLAWMNLDGTMPIWVAHGGSHGCAVVVGGNVYCWGANNFGQAGTETSTAYATTTKIKLPMPVKSLSCYSGVCCVLDISGSIRCWGQGSGGRLGTGTLNVGSTAGSMGINLPALNLGTNFQVLDVQVGGSMTCALLGNNQVKCWGLLGGQIIGTNPATQMASLLPALELGPSDVAIQISGKNTSNCVILNTYTVACWGMNNLGQLGGANTVAPDSTGVVQPSITNMTLVQLPLDVIHSSGTAATKTCSVCPANYYCTGANSGNSIVSCGNHSVSLPNSAAPSACKCKIGYAPLGQDGSCVPCQAGSYCSGGVVFSCPANSISPQGATLVTDCACKEGYTGSNGSSCNVCRQGTYKNSIGEDTCAQCPAGTASNVTAAKSHQNCTPCTAGTFSIAGSTVCTPCQPAYYSANGSESCTACDGGTYAKMGSSTCTACSPGTYGSSTPGNDPSTCFSCLAGRASAVMGATNSSVCVKCQPGKFAASAATVCESCPNNTYSVLGSTQCTACPQNAISDPGSDPSGCKCLPGYVPTSSTTEVGFTCTACPAGAWAAAGDTACTQCTAGTSSSVVAATTNSTCKTCAAGTSAQAGSVACRSCAAGFKAAAGAAACDPCAPSSWSSGNSSTCTACQAGKFALTQLTSAASCITCIAGYFCPSGMVPQMCPIGTYSSQTGFTSQSQCQACPINSFCPLPYLKSPCPQGTGSKANSTSQLQCSCQIGFQCSYSKMVQAVVVLNMSMVQFAQDGVSDSFRTAVAQAAGGIPVSNVVITNVVDSSPITPTGRRLFSYENIDPAALQSMIQDKHIHITMGLIGAEGLHNMDYHLELNGLQRSMAHEWYEDHSVQVDRTV